MERVLLLIGIALSGCRVGFDLISTTGDASTQDGPRVACAASYTFSFQGSRYRVASSDQWLSAQQDCASDGAGMHLVVFDDKSERDALTSLAAGAPTWVGISDRVQPGSWREVTGPIASYLPWSTGAPSLGGATCVVWDPSTGGISNVICNAGNARICECDGISVDPAAF